MFPLPEERKEGLTVQVYAPVAGFEPESHFPALGCATTVVNEYGTLQRTGPRRVSPMLIPTWTTNMAGMATIELGAQGPSLAHVSACASSAMSIGEETRAIGLIPP